jgi:hypothetical protein
MSAIYFSASELRIFSELVSNFGKIMSFFFVLGMVPFIGTTYIKGKKSLMLTKLIQKWL